MYAWLEYLFPTRTFFARGHFPALWKRTTAKYDIRHTRVDKYAVNSGHASYSFRRAAAIAFAEDLKRYTGLDIDVTDMGLVPRLGGNAHLIREACDVYLNTVAGTVEDDR